MDTERPENTEQRQWVGIPVFFVNESGKNEITVKKSLVFGLLLESNLSTGFSWQLIFKKNEGCVKLLAVTGHEPGGEDPRLLGSAETEKFVIEALSAGEAIFEFLYRRPWEKGKSPEKRVTVHLTVSE